MKLSRNFTWWGLGLAIAIAWTFFGLTIWQVIDYGVPAGHPVRQELMATVTRDPALKTDIALFFAGQLAIHACLGIIVWILAMAVRRAYPQRRWSMPLLIMGWSALGLGFVYVMNASLFPWSYFSSAHSLVNFPLVASVTLVDVVTVLVVTLVAGLLVRAALTFAPVRKHAVRLAAYSVVGAGVIATVHALDLRPSDRAAPFSKPNIIVIGIDSLRPDTVGRGRGIGVTPNIDAFLEEAVTFTDTVTPLARTFPSWVTILSGQHPTRSGARDNLMPRSVLTESASLADRLRSAGYVTAYATDEVRFSNIDASFGFDNVIGPKMGPSDFVLGRWGDVPLSNLLANTRVAEVLFPNIYGNRAVAQTYRPEVFIDWIDRRVDFERPTFLAMHLTLPHYPYHWADDDQELFGRTTDGSYRYLAGVVAADRQFGQMLRVLEHRGVLDNAIVVLLSDHGEALGLSSDNLLIDRAAKQAVGKLLVSMTGHGSSVLSPTQYQVLLSVRRYGHAATTVFHPGTPRSVPASLEDVSPTILQLAGIRFDEADFDGRSLATEFSAPDADAALQSRVRFTETGLTTTFMRMGNFSDNANVEEGMKFFTVDVSTSRINFRRDRFDDLLEQKERAAMSKEWLLAGIPDPDAGRLKYVFVRRGGGVPAVVTHDPASIAEPEFARLYRSMQVRFGDELNLFAQ